MALSFKKILQLLKSKLFQHDTLQNIAPSIFSEDIALTYSTPTDLSVSELSIKRVLVIGSCLSEGWAWYLNKGIAQPCDYILFNYVSQLPTTPPNPIEEYDFSLVQIPLRSVLPDTEYFRLSYLTNADYQRLFEDCVDRLRLFLSKAMQWNKEFGILSFVSNFMAPQQNPLGRLMPRYDFRNYIFFIESLNQKLVEFVDSYSNAYLLDIDRISAMHGRRFIQNDSGMQINHGGINCNWGYELDSNRLDTLKPLSNYFELHSHRFPTLVWHEVKAMYKTLRKIDAVKVVIVDLDDTLWRGIMSETEGEFNSNTIEGWPLGFVEALLHLKKLGIVLTIASKNDESFIRKVWSTVFSGRITLDDFAIYKINWKPKSENIGEIIQELNVLPASVVFIDDNPRERALIKMAYPDIRILGSNPYLLRRILLWSPETQVPIITAESSLKTEQMQAKLIRDNQKKQMTTESFLFKLNLRVNFYRLLDYKHERFERALELLNKTNQFNTTGRRWAREELLLALKTGVRIYSFEAQDIYSSYGLIGIIIFKEKEIIQVVMSCRVVGLDIELAAISMFLKLMKQEGLTSIRAKIIETPANLLSRDLFEKTGFIKIDEDCWEKNIHADLEVPAHITLNHIV